MNHKSLTHDVSLVFSRDQYNALIKSIHFVQFCVLNGLIKEFSENEELREALADATEILYFGGRIINKADPSSASRLSDIVTQFDETEDEKQREMNIDDLYNIANYIFSSEFAKRELGFTGVETAFDHDEIGDYGKRDIESDMIVNKMQPYFKELKENGISNLHLKMSSSVKSSK